MNNQMNNNIIKLTKQLFATMFQIEVDAGSPYIVEPDLDTGWDISGVISVAGSLSGLFAVRYHRRLAEYMLKRARLQNDETDGCCSLLCDMVGEVTNTITGNVLSIAGIKELYLSIPVIVQGENHIISYPRNTEIIAFPFTISSETFVVQTGLK